MKKHTIIGTAGHIDHGKTALIKALTGIDTDRLKEEKQRGITIDIGFAYWQDDVTIIDVPGHEKFIRNMVAGVSTIDFFMLIIAADDGIMPQTTEHLDILRFFNISDGIVVLNKIDLVDEEWRELVTDDIQRMLEKYQLEDIPIIPASATSGIGIDALRDALQAKIDGHEQRHSDRPFRLFADRVITFKGVGTVATGTVLSGSLSRGENLEILPGNEIIKVRGIQAHTHDVETVSTGERAALNLPGVGRSVIERGSTLCKPGTAQVVSEFFGAMRTVSSLSVNISNRSKVRVYIGTAERLGQLVWFEERKKLEPGEQWHVRIKLEEPLSAAPGDAFLIRLASPVLTLAGGRVLEINPPKIAHNIEQVAAYFRILEAGTLTDKLELLIDRRGLKPITASELAQKLFIHQHPLSDALEILRQRKKLRTVSIKNADQYIYENRFKDLCAKIIAALSQYHKTNAHQPGANSNEILALLHLKWLAPELSEAAFRYLINSKSIQQDHGLFALSGFKVQVTRDTDSVKSEILQAYFEARFAPPDTSDIAKLLDLPDREARSLCSLLVRENHLVSIHQQFYLHRKRFEELITFLKDYFKKQEEMPIAALKEFIQTSRKYAIPLFEFLDGEGFTRREGDRRKAGFNLHPEN